MEKDLARRHRLWKMANKLLLPALKRIDKIRPEMTDGRELCSEYQGRQRRPAAQSGLRLGQGLARSLLQQKRGQLHSLPWRSGDIDGGYE